MKQFTVKVGNKDFNYSFPTSIEEITSEYLQNVTSNVVINDNYSLIAQVYSESLSTIIYTRKQNKKDARIKVTPLFVRAGKTDCEVINKMHCKDIIIAAASQLNLGHHVKSPTNVLSLDRFIDALDKDVTVAQRYNHAFGKEPVHFVEFKLIPNCEIVGYYDMTTKPNSDTEDYLVITEDKETDNTVMLNTKDVN